ncbi:SDR family oxidoreductase [Agromyces protaetiae]|uniref:SDR family oxidoreductase n=1 Tax=Agromyces protaetiae TaxID=2509455 RepID=A0A4P6F9R2_9MICO|nr:SDR family oxidoreductase [Agromyces protaetiae]QAY72920.1 SDR family oxidoreductase [Agromyces protaetiae]
MHEHSELPLLGRTALVTGVSRRRGIAYAVARKLASLGANVFIQHHRPHDLDQPWGGDDLDAVRAGIRDALAPGARFGDLGIDLGATARESEASERSEPAERLIEAAAALTGHLDLLLCIHARSGDSGGILDLTGALLDAHWDVNTRSTLLLTAAFARRIAGVPTPSVDAAPRRPGERGEHGASAATSTDRPFAAPTGHVVWMTSGQIHGPMRGEVPYATSKAALAGVTSTVAAELLEIGIRLNTVNPGPVNTGYLDPETTDRPLDAATEWIATTPFGRWGRPEDTAELIAWLCTDAGSWVVGQVLTSDGGIGIS